MKKYLILALCIIPFIGFSQPKWEKKSIKTFNKDTLAYLKHNFNLKDKSMLDHFAGKTIAQIVPELEYDIKYIIMTSASGYDNTVIEGFMLVFEGDNETGWKGIDILLQTPTKDPKLHAALRSVRLVPYNQEIFSMIKNLKVKFLHFNQYKISKGTEDNF